MDEVKEAEAVNTVEIIEEVAPVKEEVSLEGLDPLEKALAEKQGVTEKAKEGTEVKPVANVEEKKEPELQTFEDTEKNEKELLKKYNKNEQALYFKWKSDKRERQEAKKEAEFATIREKGIKLELEKIRANESLSVEKLNKINNLLTGPSDNITIEAIQEILKFAPQEKAGEDKNRPVTVGDLEKIQEKNLTEQKAAEEKQKFLATRITEAENLGKTKFENYDDIVTQAQEVLEGKVEIPAIINIVDLSARLAEAIHNKDIELDTIAEYVHGIAKLNPSFGKKTASQSSAKKESNENIDRILKNASKQQTSASVSGGNGRRLVSLDDLTVEDAAKLSQEAYSKLPDNVRKRLKLEASKI